MDKFGIFKILSSLLQSVNNSNEKAEKNAQNSQDALSEILNLFNKQPNKAEQPTVLEKSKENSKKDGLSESHAFLKNRLLLTANSHDEFVKRVTKNNKP